MLRLCLWIFVSIGCLNLVAHDGHHAAPGKTIDDLSEQMAFHQNKLASNPEDTISLTRLGSLYLQKARQTAKHADFDLAIEQFEKAVTLVPSQPAAWVGLGYAHLGRHDFAQALTAARAAAELAPNKAETAALLADVHLALGHSTEAALLAETLLEQKTNVAALARVAQAAEQRGDLKTAEARYDQAASIANPDEHAWLQTMLAEIYLQTGRTDRAFQAFEIALDNAHASVYAHSRLATLARKRGEIDTALHHARHAQTLAPHRPGVIFERGKVALSAGDLTTAVRCFKRATAIIEAELKRGDEGHLRELAQFLEAQNQNLPRALTLARRDLAKRGDWESRELVAWLQFRNDQIPEALTSIRWALRPGVRHPRLMLRAGLIFEAAGLNFHAVHAYRQGLQAPDAVEIGLLKLTKARYQALLDNPSRVAETLQNGARTKSRTH